MPSLNEHFGKMLVFTGFLCLLGGLFLLYGKNLPLFSRLGKLPLDIRIEKENFQFYFPLGSCLLISVILTLLFRIFGGRQ